MNFMSNILLLCNTQMIWNWNNISSNSFRVYCGKLMKYLILKESEALEYFVAVDDIVEVCDSRTDKS